MPATSIEGWRCFEERPRGPRGERAPELDDEESTGRGGALVCAACRHRITDQDARVAVHDRHEHAFVNPHGYAFIIGCFASAPGCVQIGPPSSEFTWFAGYTWRIAHCGGCGIHLGWRFQSENHAFHGLIVDKLAELSDDDS